MLKRLMYGCWSLGNAREDEAFRAYDAAYENGYRMFDNADFYVGGKTESIFGRWMANRDIDRSDLFIQTKVGIRNTQTENGGRISY